MTEEANVTEANTAEGTSTDSLMGGDSQETQTQETNTVDGNEKTTVSDAEARQADGYPEGFDSTTYNIHTGEYKYDKIAEKMNDLESKWTNADKQAKDLRRIVSKGYAPEDETEYDVYRPDSKYEKYYDFEQEQNEVVSESIKTLNKLSKDLGLNIEQNGKVKDFLNLTMEKAGVFNTKSPEQIEQEATDWKNAQLESLGDKPNRIINETKEFIETNPSFNDAQKQMLVKLANTEGAEFIKAMHSLHVRVNNNRGIVPAPSSVDAVGRPDLNTLAHEYNSKDTTTERRMEIVKMLRPGETLPLLK